MAFADIARRMLRVGTMAPLSRFRCDLPLLDAILRYRAGAEGPILVLLRARTREASEEDRQRVERHAGSAPWSRAMEVLRVCSRVCARVRMQDRSEARGDAAATAAVAEFGRGVFTSQPTEVAHLRIVFFTCSFFVLSGPSSGRKRHWGPQLLHGRPWQCALLLHGRPWDLVEAVKAWILAVARHLSEAAEVDVGALNESSMDDGQETDVGRSHVAMRPSQLRTLMQLLRHSSSTGSWLQLRRKLVGCTS